jgi:hypothetical protein
MKRVFVSYSRHNLKPVMQLVHDLNAVGVDTWHDQALTTGKRWWDDILANIRECDIYVFALSPESLDSEACRSELGYAEKLCKPILPVRVSGDISLDLLPHPLNEIQVTDCRSGEKESCFALVKSIMSTPLSPALPDPLPAPPPVPISYLSTLNDRIASTEPLSSQEQITLLFELEEELREGRSPAEVHDLLLRLKRRDDLLAKIATKIDAALKSLGDNSTAQPREIETPESSLLSQEVSDPPPARESCTQCGTRLDAGSRFCKVCGTAVGRTSLANVPIPSPGPSSDDGPPAVAGSKSRRYTCPAADSPRLVADVKHWLDSQDFDTQQMRTNDQALMLQIKKRGGWRDFVGMSTSLNILFYQSGDTLTVQIGAGKWIDKAAAGTVSLFILWPLAITAGFGAWQQMKMPEKVFDFIGSRLAYK